MPEWSSDVLFPCRRKGEVGKSHSRNELDPGGEAQLPNHSLEAEQQRLAGNIEWLFWHIYNIHNTAIAAIRRPKAGNCGGISKYSFPIVWRTSCFFLPTWVKFNYVTKLCLTLWIIFTEIPCEDILAEVTSTIRAKYFEQEIIRWWMQQVPMQHVSLKDVF